MFVGQPGQDAKCDCPAHRRGAIEIAGEVGREAPPSPLASMLPALACVVCPACIASYSSALSAVGISATLGEAYHHYFLAVALLLTLGLQAHRAHRTRRRAPLVAAIVGSTLLVAGHALDDSGFAAWSPLLVWAGVAVLLGGSLLDAVRTRRAHARG
jgi:hypothetical protein